MCFFCLNHHTIDHSLIIRGIPHATNHRTGHVFHRIRHGSHASFAGAIFRSCFYRCAADRRLQPVLRGKIICIYKNIVKRHMKPSRLTILSHGRLSSFHKTGFQAGSAYIHFPCGFSNLNPNGLDIGFPHPI